MVGWEYGPGSLVYIKNIWAVSASRQDLEDTLLVLVNRSGLNLPRKSGSSQI